MKKYTFRKSIIVGAAILTVVLAALAVFSARIETRLAEGLCAIVMLGALIYMASAQIVLDEEKLTFRAFKALKVFPWGEITSAKKFQEGKKAPSLEVKSKGNTLVIQWYIAHYQELMDEIQKRVPHTGN